MRPAPAQLARHTRQRKRKERRHPHQAVVAEEDVEEVRRQVGVEGVDAPRLVPVRALVMEQVAAREEGHDGACNRVVEGQVGRHGQHEQEQPYERRKGVRYLLCEAPEGPFRQKVPDTFSSPQEVDRKHRRRDQRRVVHRHRKPCPEAEQGVRRRPFSQAVPQPVRPVECREKPQRRGHVVGQPGRVAEHQVGQAERAVRTDPRRPVRRQEPAEPVEHQHQEEERRRAEDQAQESGGTSRVMLEGHPRGAVPGPVGPRADHGEKRRFGGVEVLAEFGLVDGAPAVEGVVDAEGAVFDQGLDGGESAGLVAPGIGAAEPRVSGQDERRRQPDERPRQARTPRGRGAQGMRRDGPGHETAPNEAVCRQGVFPRAGPGCQGLGPPATKSVRRSGADPRSENHPTRSMTGSMLNW